MAGLIVEGLKVRSLYVDFLEVTWRTVSTAEDVLDYTFQVLRSEAAMGPFEAVSPEIEDQYIFVDNRIKSAHAYRNYFYKIALKHKPSGEVTEFGPASLGDEPDLIAQELRSHFNLLMKEFVGRRCWVLPVRTFGQRCPNCYDNTLKKRTKSNCITCYDTSFVRGYHSPIETFIQFDPNSKNEQQTAMGQLQQSNTTARMGYFPPLQPRDLIIEAENRRWRVVGVSQTERLRVPLHQEVQMHEIPKSDIEYRITFDLGEKVIKGAQGEILTPITLNMLPLAGSRNYTNPHTLENVKDDEVLDYFNLYPR